MKISRVTNYEKLLYTVLKRVVIFHKFNFFHFLSSHRCGVDFQAVTRYDMFFYRRVLYCIVMDKIFFRKMFGYLKIFFNFANVVFHLLKESVSKSPCNAWSGSHNLRGFFI